jgi:hypothetical protein
MKVVINRCHGGFGLSNEAFEWLIQSKGWKVTNYSKDDKVYEDPTAQLVNADSSFGNKYYMVDNHSDNETRTNPDIIEVVETLGKAANGMYASLGITDVPDDVEWEIGEYDGSEWVQELHRKWS